jgi:flagellar basal-body rod protein FlgC
MSDGNLFRAFDVSAAGLTAQRVRLNVLSANIANAQTTRTPEGGAYRRRVVTLSSPGPVAAPRLFERLLAAKRALELDVAKTSPRHLDETRLASFADRPEEIDHSVTIDVVTPTRLEYDPGHPDANAEGYVEYPNVDIIREMVQLLAATRAYEANVTVLNSTKTMLKKALEI